MIMIIGLLILIAAAALAVAGFAANRGSGHPAGVFHIFGQHLTGLSTGHLFLYGVVVGVVGMLGLSMLLGAFTRRLASRRSQRELKGSQRENIDLRTDRDRLAQQLDDARTERSPADTSGPDDGHSPIDSTPSQPQPASQAPPAAEPAGVQQPDGHHRAR
jgi:hypothetical protein